MIICLPGQENSSAYLYSFSFIENATNEFEDDVNDLDQESMMLIVILRKIGFIPIYVIIFATGILGNSLVIIAILRLKRLKSVTNIFLLSLATSDLIVIIVCVPIKV